MSNGFSPGHFQIGGGSTFKLNEKPEEYKEYRLNWAKYPQEKYLSQFPLHLDLESTSACNLACEYCSRNSMSGNPGLMSFDLFKKIIDEGAEHGLASIKLNRRGEPLLHKRLSEFIAYAKTKGIMDVQFNCNGTMLNDEVGRKLIDAGLDRIIFSVDGVDPETFAISRVGAEYDDVVHRIESFIELREKMGRGKPEIRMQMAVSPSTINEVIPYIKLWRPLADVISFNMRRDPSTPSGKGGVGEHEVSFPSMKQAKTLDGNALIVHEPCPQIWQRLAVMWDGTTVMCCEDWHERHVLGNANEKTIHEMWSGEKYATVRAAHLEGHPEKIDICRTCEYMIRRDTQELERILAEACSENA